MHYYLLRDGQELPQAIHHFQGHVFVESAADEPPPNCILPTPEFFSDFMYTMHLDATVEPFADPAHNPDEAPTAFLAGPASYLHFLSNYVVRASVMGRGSCVAAITQFHGTLDVDDRHVKAWDAYLLGLGQPALIRVAIHYYFAVTAAAHWQLVAKLSADEYTQRPNIRNDYKKALFSLPPKFINCYLTDSQKRALLL